MAGNVKGRAGMEKVWKSPCSIIRGGALFESLRYKSEGRGFSARWFHWIFL